MYHEHTMLSDTQNKQNRFSAIEAPGLMSALCPAEEAAGRCLHSRCNGRLSAPGRGNLRGVLQGLVCARAHQSRASGASPNASLRVAKRLS